MPFCPNCGAEVSGRFCARCGEEIADETESSSSQFSSNWRKEVSQSQPVEYSQQRSNYKSEEMRKSAYINLDPQSYRMGWHHFLVHFYLWVTSIMNIGVAAVFCTQSSGFDTLKAIMLIWLFAMAAFLIYVRFQLAGFRKGAPVKLAIAFALPVCLNLIGLIIPLLVPNLEAILYYSVQFSSLSLIQFIMFVCNWKYYSNRRELFVK